jgi:hypothetical protein
MDSLPWLRATKHRSAPLPGNPNHHRPAHRDQVGHRTAAVVAKAPALSLSRSASESRRRKVERDRHALLSKKDHRAGCPDWRLVISKNSGRRTFVQKLRHDKRIQRTILGSSRRFLLKSFTERSADLHDDTGVPAPMSPNEPPSRDEADRALCCAKKTIAQAAQTGGL